MALPATDDFAGAAGALPDPPWTQQKTDDVRRDGSGSAICTVKDRDLYVHWNADLFPDDQYSKIEAGQVATDDAIIRVVTRASGVGDSSYNNYFTSADGGSGATHFEFGKNVLGAETILRNFTATLIATDWLELQSVATEHTTLVDNASLGSHTDATIPSGAPGLGILDVTGGVNALISAWEGGSLAGPDIIRSRHLATQQRMIA